jgi:ABC-type multidrug transport system ATPase subunit
MAEVAKDPDKPEDLITRTRRRLSASWHGFSDADDADDADDDASEGGDEGVVSSDKKIKPSRYRRSRSNATNESDLESSDDERGYRSGDGKGDKKKKKRRLFRGSLLRRDASRNDHLRVLVQERKARVRYFNKLLGRREGGDQGDVEAPEVPSEAFAVTPVGADIMELSEAQKENVKKSSDALRRIQAIMEEFNAHMQTQFPIEIRMEGLTYSAPDDLNGNKIHTVYNSSYLYVVVKFFKNLRSGGGMRQKMGTKVILDDISVVLKPGKMYLLLGPPASGKSSFLRAVAGRLSVEKGETTEGSVFYNGILKEDKTKFYIDNSIGFIDQLDRHAPRLTVDDTFEFAYQCKRGGTHINFKHFMKTDEAKKLAARADSERILVTSTLDFLGLSHVKDTYVGNEEVRGVSGGQRRRVTVGEMLMNASPILCGDEISNGLDAASTFDMIQILMHVGRVQQHLCVISLLQPSPETVSLFDEVILVSEGQLLYSGPISSVEDYFASLGYIAPPHMDVADFLQLLSTPEAESLYDPPPDAGVKRTIPHSAKELAEIFRQSKGGKEIQTNLKGPYRNVWGSARHGVEEHEDVAHLDDKRFQHRYANSFPRSVWLNLKRNLLIWIRDRRVLIANAVKNIIMGISVGGVFFQTEDVISVLGVLFQGMLFIMLGKSCFYPYPHSVGVLCLTWFAPCRCDDECTRLRR